MAKPLAGLNEGSEVFTVVTGSHECSGCNGSLMVLNPLKLSSITFSLDLAGFYRMTAFLHYS